MPTIDSHMSVRTYLWKPWIFLTTILWNLSSSAISQRFKLFHTSHPYNTPGITTLLLRLIEVFGLSPHGRTPISAMLKKDYVPFAHASLTPDDSDRFDSWRTPRCKVEWLCGIVSNCNFNWLLGSSLVFPKKILHMICQHETHNDIYTNGCMQYSQVFVDYGVNWP